MSIEHERDTPVTTVSTDERDAMSDARRAEKHCRRVFRRLLFCHLRTQR